MEDKAAKEKLAKERLADWDLATAAGAGGLQPAPAGGLVSLHAVVWSSSGLA